MPETLQKILADFDSGVPMTLESLANRLCDADAPPELWLKILDVIEREGINGAKLREMIAPITLFPDRDRKD